MAQQAALVAGIRAGIPALNSQLQQLVNGLGILTGQPPEAFCMACYNGHYPVPYDPLLDKHIIERRRKSTQTLGEAAAKENEQIKLLHV